MSNQKKDLSEKKTDLGEQKMWPENSFAAKIMPLQDAVDRVVPVKRAKSRKIPVYSDGHPHDPERKP
jgi:hypothetical protein